MTVYIHLYRELGLQCSILIDIIGKALSFFAVISEKSVVKGIVFLNIGCPDPNVCLSIVDPFTWD